MRGQAGHACSSVSGLRTLRAMSRMLPLTLLLLLAASATGAIAQPLVPEGSDTPVANEATTTVRSGAELVDSAQLYFRSHAWQNPDWHDACLTPDYVAKPAVCDPPTDRIPMTRNVPPIITGLRPGIDARDLTSQWSLAHHYDRGRYLPRDYPEAAKWYAVAAREGLAAAQYELGTMYAEGVGVEQSDQAAFSLMDSAADQAYPPALAYEQAMLAGRDRRVRAAGGVLYDRPEALTGYGTRHHLPGGMNVLVFDRLPQWYRVYVRHLDRWGWVRREHVEFRVDG